MYGALAGIKHLDRPEAASSEVIHSWLWISERAVKSLRLVRVGSRTHTFREATLHIDEANAWLHWCNGRSIALEIAKSKVLDPEQDRMVRIHLS